MYKPSASLVVTLFPTYLLCTFYIWDLLPTLGLARSNHILTQVKVHPQLSHNRHPVDDVLVVLVHSGPVFFFPWWNFIIFWQRNWENFGIYLFVSVNLTTFSKFFGVNFAKISILKKWSTKKTVLCPHKMTQNKTQKVIDDPHFDYIHSTAKKMSSQTENPGSNLLWN